MELLLSVIYFLSLYNMASGDPVKILELTQNDWMKGISLQDTYPIGGIFQSSSYNFDPFETIVIAAT